MSGKENYTRAIQFEGPGYLPCTLGVDLEWLYDRDEAKQQPAQSQVGRIHNRYTQFPPHKSPVAIRAPGDQQVVPVAPVQAKAGRDIVVIAGVALEPSDAKVEEGTQRLPSDAHLAQASAGMRQNGHATRLADNGDRVRRMRERGPFQVQGVHQLVKIVARTSAIAEID